MIFILENNSDIADEVLIDIFVALIEVYGTERGKKWKKKKHLHSNHSKK